MVGVCNGPINTRFCEREIALLVGIGAARRIMCAGSRLRALLQFLGFRGSIG